MSAEIPWKEADRRALQDVARVSREVAARGDVSAGVAEKLERGAMAILHRIPDDRPPVEVVDA